MHFPTFCGRLCRPSLNAWLAPKQSLFRAVRSFHCSQVVTGRRWSAPEDAALIRALNEGQKQDDIAKRLPGRTSTTVKHRIAKLRRLKGPSEVKQSRQYATWSVEEDAILKDAKHKGLCWPEIGKFFPTRSLNSLRFRFAYLSQGRKADKIGTPFSPEEDAQLKHGREVLRLGFPAIAAGLAGRHPATLSVRYRHLTSSGNRTTIPQPTKWQGDEVVKLRRLLESGKTQPEIAQVLGRTRNAVVSKIRTLRYEPEQCSFDGRFAKPWSAEEYTLLRELLTQGHSTLHIAQQLKRSISAMNNKLYHYGLRRRGG